MWAQLKDLLRLLPFYGINPIPVPIPITVDRSSTALKLRHAFVANPTLPQSFATPQNPPQILFNDILVAPDLRDGDHDYTQAATSTFALRTHPIRVNRARDQEQFHEARRQSFYSQQSAIIDWDETEVLAPDLTDRPTVLELAKMTGNAYVRPEDKGWYDVGGRWNTSYPFGWDPEDNGFRGNVFVSDDNSTVVLSIKGTSLYGQGNTATRDKLNDNRLYSCCCARISRNWGFSTVCDCFNGGWSCGQSCLERSLQDDDLFYNVGINLFNNLTYIYPDANVWIVGHSLGGGLSGLLGATFGVPTITFEALGDRLAASRLHLPSPPPTSLQLQTMNGRNSDDEEFSLHPITHIFHTADPVPHGTCTGIRSLCAKAGYALEARCHLGKIIVYDTITRFKWSQALIHHPIAVMITKILAEDWEEDRPVPEAVPQINCFDCYKWDYLDED